MCIFRIARINILLNCSYIYIIELLISMSLNCSYYWITYIYILLNCSSHIYILLNNSGLGSYAMLTYTIYIYISYRYIVCILYIPRYISSSADIYWIYIFPRYQYRITPIITAIHDVNFISGIRELGLSIYIYYAVWPIGITTVTYMSLRIYRAYIDTASDLASTIRFVPLTSTPIAGFFDSRLSRQNIRHLSGCKVP